MIKTKIQKVPKFMLNVECERCGHKLTLTEVSDIIQKEYELRFSYNKTEKEKKALFHEVRYGYVCPKCNEENIIDTNLIPEQIQESIDYMILGSVNKMIIKGTIIALLIVGIIIIL